MKKFTEHIKENFGSEIKESIVYLVRFPDGTLVNYDHDADHDFHKNVFHLLGIRTLAKLAFPSKHEAEALVKELKNDIDAEEYHAYHDGHPEVIECALMFKEIKTIDSLMA